jgi:hypothetical protein
MFACTYTCNVVQIDPSINVNSYAVCPVANLAPLNSKGCSYYS